MLGVLVTEDVQNMSEKRLMAVGFSTQETDMFSAGDVAIVQPIQGHPHGHIAMYNGAKWVSDFKQSLGVYPSASYRRVKPTISIYRHP
jgi:hypothetical protein